MSYKKRRIQEIQEEQIPKIFIGVSTNHKEINDEEAHRKVRFKNQWLGLGGIVQCIEDGAYLYPPITNIEESKRNDEGYLVHSAYSFSDTYIIPFDIDEGEYKMETFLDKLPDDLLPTVVFKTKSNDEDNGTYCYRLLYIFKQPFVTREYYYSAYESIKEEIMFHTGDFGKDEYAYGLSPNSKGRKGSCCKPIRTSKSSEIIVNGHYYSQDEFFIPIVFQDLDYDVSDKIDCNLFSSNLYDLVMRYHKSDIPYSLIPFRDFSLTKSEFNKGFAFVRGNYNYAEFLRKFEPKYNNGQLMKNPKTGRVCYQPSKWSVGEHRHRKLWTDALIARFNDYIENGLCTLCGDELFMILYDEAHRWFEIKDKEGNDVITNKFLMETASEALSMDINDVIDIVVEHNKRWDSRKILKRQICRIDYNHWNNEGMLQSKEEIKALAQHTAKFLLLLRLYNPEMTLFDNTIALDKIEHPYVPPHSVATLAKFLKECRIIEQYRKNENNISERVSEEKLKELLFSEEGLTAISVPTFYEYINSFLKQPEYNFRYRSIIDHKTNNYWEQVKSGAKVKPNNGRPKSLWHSILSEKDSLLSLSSLVEKVHKEYPDVKESSIKTWKYRQKKKRCA